MVVTAGKEYHASGIDVPCLGTPEQPWPWLPLHAAEANEDGSDKYAAGTCYLKPGVVCYFPTVKPPENRVLIYYAAKELDQFTPMVVARDVAEQAKWILFVVNTYPEKPEPKTLNAGDLLTADEIVEELARHNLEARIDRLRMVAHSRGILRLLHNTDEGRNLVSASPSGNVFDIGAVERVLSIDATHTRAPFPLLTARFPKRFYGLYLFTSGFDTLVPTSKRTIASQYLYALAAARVIESLPYFRAKWPHVAKLQLESTYDAAVKAIAMRMTGTTALKPIGKISSHDFQDALSHVKQGLSDANVTAKNLMLHACKLGDIQHLQHNWTIADFFHEATDDLAPATDMP